MRRNATGQQPLLSKFLLPATGIEPWAFARQSDALTTWLTSPSGDNKVQSRRETLITQKMSLPQSIRTTIPDLPDREQVWLRNIKNLIVYGRLYNLIAGLNVNNPHPIDLVVYNCSHSKKISSFQLIMKQGGAMKQFAVKIEVKCASYSL